MKPTTLIGSALSLIVGSAAAAEQPNVLIIYIDDMGIGDIGCYGGKFTPTPNIDRLAKEGIRFEQYYSASPVSSSSRCALITGQYPIRHGINTYLSNRRHNRNVEQVDYLDSSAPSISRAFHNAGYKTAHIGKWHLGGGRDVYNAPKFVEYGYDEYVSTYESPEADEAITSSDWIWAESDSIPRWKRTEYFVDKSIDFMERNSNSPMFINLWVDDVHTPWVPESKYYNDEKSHWEEQNFTPVLAELDVQIGRLIKYMDESGLSENTLIVFTSDNGPETSMGRRRSASLRGSKNSLFEGGIRMPFIVKYPGVIDAGIVNSSSVLSAMDMYPTLCSIVGIPTEEGYKADGATYHNVMLGKSNKKRKKDLMWDFGRNRFFAFPKEEGFRSPHLAIRSGDWKLLINSDGSDAMLFDMASDAIEQHNVADLHPKVVQKLSKRVIAWYNLNRDSADLTAERPMLLPAEDFKATLDNKEVSLYTLKNKSGLTMQVTNFGARVVALWTPDRNGKWNDIVIGYENIERYTNNTGERFLGAAIGRFGNRIANGQFNLGGVNYQLSTYNNGQCLHGGDKGFDSVVWSVERVTENSIEFSYTSPDMEEGFPGTLSVNMVYQLTDANEFRVDYKATTDKATPVNLTHHSFFNLRGEGNGSINNHILSINAKEYTPIGATLIPLGEHSQVEGTPFDFRKPKAIGTDLNIAHQQLINAKGYDHNFVLSRKTKNQIERVATVYEPISGREMQVWTSEPGLQFYGGNFFDGTTRGKRDKYLRFRESFALETQHFPDSPNQPKYPTTILNPGQTYSHTCIYKFSTRK